MYRHSLFFIFSENISQALHLRFHIWWLFFHGFRFPQPRRSRTNQSVILQNIIITSSCSELEIVEGNCEGILSLYYVQQKYYNTLPLRPLHLQTLVLKAFWETTPSPHCLLGLRPMTVKTPRTHKPPWVPQFLTLPQKRQKRRQYNPQGSLKAASTKWPLHFQKNDLCCPPKF